MTNKAFTLAEVLITLGIIGIVAAMTLPTIMANTEKQQTSAKLKKAYSTFANALMISQYDNEESANWQASEPSSTYEENLEYLKKYWFPYLSVMKICKDYKECGYDKGGYGILSDRDNTVFYGQFNNVPGFILSDGTYAYIRPYHLWSTADTPQKLQLLSIDLNGAKKPNVIGRDVFQFVINISKGNIGGFGDPDWCTIDNIKDSTENARSCGGKIMSDSWEFKKDYPWNM